MAKRFVQAGLNAGELSPHLAFRFETDRYAYGLKRMRNFIPMLQGPARKRPGFRFGMDAGEKCWFVRFVFEQTDAWVLLFGEERVRFFSNGGQVVESAQTITAISQANPGVVTIAGHPYANGDEVVIDSVAGMTELNGRNFTVANDAANTFTLVDMWGDAVDTSAYTAYTSGGTAERVYEIASPWTLDDLTNADGTCAISYAQSNDVIYICVPGFQTQKLTRTTATSWAFTDFEPTGGPFQTIDPDETITVYAGAATGNTTATSSSGIFTDDMVGALFMLEKTFTDDTKAWEAGKSITAGDDRRSQGHYYDALNTATTGTIVPSHTEGALFDGDTGVQWNYLDSGYGWAEITAFNSTTSVDITVLSRLNAESVGAGNASTQWALGAWSDEEGWPTHVTFWRDRLVFLRDTKAWGSVPSDYESFLERDHGVTATDSAFSIDIARGENDAINAVVASTDLLVFTPGGEFTVGTLSASDPAGPDNIGSNIGPGYGSRQVDPVRIADAAFYALPSGRIMRNLRFDFSSDTYVALNMVAFADHVLKGQLIRQAFQREPESVIWQCCLDGTVPTLAFEAEHNLIAWALQEVGGSFSGGAPVVEDVLVIPSPDGYRDEVYILVKRTINGQTKHYLEYSEDHWDPETDDAEDMFYVDSGLTYSGSAVSALTNLEHLEGESVRVLADGRDLGEFTVTDRSITVDVTADAQVGFAYTATLISLNLVEPGNLMKVVRWFVRVIGTALGKVAGTTNRDRDTQTWGPRDVPFQFSGYDISAPVPPVSRIIRTGSNEIEGDHGREVYMEWRHDAPTACTIAGWSMHVDVSKEE